MIGTVIGNYKITQKIGEGGMGAVFKGVDLMLEREVAIKMLRPELASQPDVVERFRSEAVTLAKLNHPNIATLYAFLRHANDFFMVMEYVQGYTLDSLIRRNGAMPVNHAVTLFCQALEGIGRAHKLGIIHRDIKPANMMLTAEDGSIKVMDFGIARVLGTARMTRQGNIVGTIEYMSPEAIKGEDVDARTDIYSLGILLYELLTGRLPFVSDTEFGMMMAQIEQAPPPPTSIAPHVPAGIERGIMRALAKRREARFQTASEFREALMSGLGSSYAPTQSMQAPAPPPTRVVSPAPSTPPQRAATPDPRPVTPTPGPPSGSASAPPKETRFANPGSNPSMIPPGIPPGAHPNTPVGAVPPPQYAYAQAPGQQYSYSQPPYSGQYAGQPAQASFFSRLSWVHYAAAAIVVVAVVGISFFIIGARKSDPPVRPGPPVANQPAPDSTAVSPTQASPATSPAQPAPNQPPPQVPGLSDGEISSGSPRPAQPAANKARPVKKKPDDDLARRRREARKLLDQ